MGLVENIRYLCKEIGMSIPKLERHLGFGKGAIYKWEKSSPTIDNLEKVADYLKVSVDYLLDRGNVFDLGPYIRDEREEQGILEDEFSATLGISTHALEQYEDGRTPLTQDLVDKIMLAFNMSFPRFLNKYGLSDMEIPTHVDGDVEKLRRHKKAEEKDVANEEPVGDSNKCAIDTVAAHLAGKDITPKKLKLIEQYIDALFEDGE